jgi:hypothetical protein
MKRILSLGIFTLVTTFSFGQSSNDHKDLIIYDPLFWRDQLKLSNSQSKKIREINIEYYEGLITSYNSKKGRSNSSMKNEMEFQLEKRSERIWNTFDSRQRRRWERLTQQGLTSQSSL